MATDRTLFCFGYGYTAARLARALMAEGWRAAGTRREAAEAEGLAEREGVRAFAFSRERPLSTDVLKGVTHILHAIPPEAAGDPVLDALGEAIAGLKSLVWMGYLSTTGVYGDRGGAWVDETADVRPATERARRRAAAEAAWLALGRHRGVPVHVFRLSGIYGPGRSALDQLRAGNAHRIAKPGHVFSRAHVDDIVETLRASMARPAPGTVYNVADDLPAPQHEVIAFAAGLLGVEPPPLVPFEEASLSPMARSFYAECRRVSNRRIKEALGVRLRHPDYRAGLAAILAAGG